MVRKFAALTVLIASLACSKQQNSAPTTGGEETYAMTAIIVSRDPAKNTVNLDNKEVPGKMMAMKMDYEVRGARVSSLPPDGAAVVVTVHDKNGSYFVTNVRPTK